MLSWIANRLIFIKEVVLVDRESLISLIMVLMWSAAIILFLKDSLGGLPPLLTVSGLGAEASPIISALKGVLNSLLLLVIA